MKIKKGRIASVVIPVLVLSALITVICIRSSKPRYDYDQINRAFQIHGLISGDDQYVDANLISRERLARTALYLNLYNDRLSEKGKPAEDALSIDEVLDFYSSEYDGDGEPVINNLPPKIEDYLDWYWFHGLSKKSPDIDNDTFHEAGNVTAAMFGLGVYSERKNTQQVSDVVIDDPVDFFVNLYVYNMGNPSEMITEDEVKAAMVGGSEELLDRFGSWYRYIGSSSIDSFYSRLNTTYYKSSYRTDHPDAPFVSDMDVDEIRQLIDYMESLEE